MFVTIYKRSFTKRLFTIKLMHRSNISKLSLDRITWSFVQSILINIPLLPFANLTISLPFPFLPSSHYFTSVVKSQPRLSHSADLQSFLRENSVHKKKMRITQRKGIDHSYMCAKTKKYQNKGNFTISNNYWQSKILN